MLTFTFSFGLDGCRTVARLDPGIVASPEEGGRVVLGKHGRLSNLAVLPFLPSAAPSLETRSDGQLTILEAYPVETSGSASTTGTVLTLGMPRAPDGPLFMVRFMLGGTVEPARRGRVVPRAGDPSLLGMATIISGSTRWPWTWHSDSVWTLTPGDRLTAIGQQGSWEIYQNGDTLAMRVDYSLGNQTKE